MARPFALVLCLASALTACAREAPNARSSRADVFLAAETETVEARVPHHATLDGLLRDHEVPAELVHAAVVSARAVFNPRDLRAGRPYRLVRSIDGVMREFIYEIDDDRFLRIISRDLTHPYLLEAEVLRFEKETAIVAIRGLIDAQHPSLIAAFDETGEEIHLALATAEIFGGEIDFHSDLQPGDTFEVLFEKSTREGQSAGYGAILGARFSVDGRAHQAFRWVDPISGKAGYYDQDGRSLKRMLLSSPLRFEPRITSAFSRRRLHPVHRTYRPHLGMDYAAPPGAAVVAVAHGVVVSAGWSGGGGRAVHLRHAGGFETYYLHLSAFGKGIRKGARVEQGELIGRVGSTGTATGPHLDYRLKRNGVFVNPITAHRSQPPGEPIPSIQLAAFRAARDTLLARLSSTVLADAPRQKPDAVKAAH